MSPASLSSIVDRPIGERDMTVGVEVHISVPKSSLCSFLVPLDQPKRSQYIGGAGSSPKIYRSSVE